MLLHVVSLSPFVTAMFYRKLRSRHPYFVSLSIFALLHACDIISAPSALVAADDANVVATRAQPPFSVQVLSITYYYTYFYSNVK